MIINTSDSYKQRVLQSVAFSFKGNNDNPIPDVLRIETTNVCNDSCIFCGNRKMSRSLGFIREEIVAKAITQGYNMGIKKISFHTTGEPLLHPQLSRFISFAKETGFEYTFFNTNGACTSSETFAEVTLSGIDSIAFSINAINRQDYKLIHGNDDFDRVMKTLEWLYKFRSSNRLSFNLYVSFIKTRYTDYDDDAIKKVFTGKCDEIKIQNVQNIGGFCPDMDSLTVEYSDTFFHYEIPCRIPFKSIVVTYEGYLTACSVDYQNYLVYADLNTCDMADAWNNNIIANLRKRHLTRDVTGLLCDNCANLSESTPSALIPAYATEFNISNISNSEETNSRIERWRKSV